MKRPKKRSETEVAAYWLEHDSVPEIDWSRTGVRLEFDPDVERPTRSITIVKLALKEGFTGGAAITLQGKGAPLDMPTLPLDQTPKVVAQIKNNTTGVCWDANYSTPASKNDQAQFRDKSD